MHLSNVQDGRCKKVDHVDIGVYLLESGSMSASQVEDRWYMYMMYNKNSNSNDNNDNNGNDNNDKNNDNNNNL